MGLREDMTRGEVRLDQDYLTSIETWRISDVSVPDQNYEMRVRSIERLGDPVAFYRDIPIFYIDNNNFDAMLDVIGGENELCVDLEFHTSNSFLGK